MRAADGLVVIIRLFIYKRNDGVYIWIRNDVCIYQVCQSVQKVSGNFSFHDGYYLHVVSPYLNNCSRCVTQPLHTVQQDFIAVGAAVQFALFVQPPKHSEEIIHVSGNFLGTPEKTNNDREMELYEYTWCV